MKANKKIDVLVIPDLFPRYNGDLQGVFIPDHLMATAPHCQQRVFVFRLWSGSDTVRKGVYQESLDHAHITRFFLLDGPASRFMKPLRYLHLFFKAYRAAVSMNPPDIVHAHGSILSGTLGYLLSRKWKVPFVLTEHQGPFSVISDRFIMLRWCRFIMGKADIVLTVSEHLKKEILDSGIEPKRMEVSYNPVNTDLFRLRNQDIQNKILFAGRLDNFKGALRCLLAFSALHTRFPVWTYVIYGDGQDLTAIRELLKQDPALASKVRLKGAYAKQELAEELSDTAFFVFPSWHESFGLVVAEALSCGVPVITSNTTALKELVNDKSGRLVDPASVEEITKAMEYMMQHHTEFNPSIIRQSCLERFSEQVFGERVVNFYKSLIVKNHLN